MLAGNVIVDNGWIVANDTVGIAFNDSFLIILRCCLVLMTLWMRNLLCDYDDDDSHEKTYLALSITIPQYGR
jgi:hypothetical protein